MKTANTDTRLLEKLRTICLCLPEAKEEIKWGHPVFVAGKKMFAGFGEHEGEPCLGFKVPDDRFDVILKDARFFPTPYAARFNWVSTILRGQIDWQEIAGHLQQSYRLVALKRMLVELDASAPAKGKRPAPKKKK